ncbi:MAG: cysteine synthase A [Bacilli bacterium]|nr:cysteine synthase A [Bacilli bacterium]
MKAYDSIIETIGNTPLIRLHKIEEKYELKSHLYAKLEGFNPSGSVKTRPAWYMLKNLYKEGLMDNETLVIEATSGNTGIGLAMVAAYLGNPCTLIMPDTLSKERIDYMKLYGAKIILTDGALGINGSIQKALELNKEVKNSVIPSQFANQNNPLAHYLTTGPEIDEAMAGKVDYVFSGVGTGGTISGLARYFKEKEFDIKMIAIEPKTSSVLSGNAPGKHKIQGIGAGFIPEILDVALIDEILQVEDEDAFTMTRLLPKLEGISIGISSGAVLSATIQYLKEHQIESKNVVMIFPDSAEKYFSTGVFD